MIGQIVKYKKTLIGWVLLVLWGVFVAKFISIGKEMPAFNNYIDSPACLEDLKDGMSHAQVRLWRGIGLKSLLFTTIKILTPIIFKMA